MEHTDHPAKRRRLSAYQNGSDMGKGVNDGEQGYALDGGDLNHGSIENTKGAARAEISIFSSSKLAGQTIAPFLAQHIPEQLAPVGASSTKAESPQKTMNSKYCYRHRPDLKCRRKADEPSTEQMQHELESLSQSDQQGIAHVWTLFSAAPAKHRQLMLQGILTQCCFPQLSYLSGRVRELVRIDFLSALPTELGFKILCYLDTTSLCKATQVSQRWRSLADDDVVWHRMCEQHIDRKCTRCGWGLPLLERKRLRATKRQIQLRSTGKASKSPEITSKNNGITLPLSLDHNAAAGPSSTSTNGTRSPPEASLPTSFNASSSNEPRLRPWKDVYKDRFKVGSNWKHGRYSTMVVKGHYNGVMCLQFDEHILATGSYDATIKIWDIDTGKLLRTLHGHTSGIRALQFDSTKLISGSIDQSLKIWNWRTGECLSTYTGHSGGIIGLHFDNQLLASGSADHSVRIWNFEDRSTFALNGHSDWVNAVRVDSASRTVLSASDDCTIRLWDLDTRATIKVYRGHVGQVQQVLPLPMEFEFEDGDANDTSSEGDDTSTSTAPPMSNMPYNTSTPFSLSAERAAHLPRYMITGALDNTIRLWDVQSGRCLRTLFGHVEGIWALAADSLRIVSGSEDRTVKVWDARSGKCERNFAGHAGPVTCVGLSDSRVVTGGEDCEVRIYSFKGPLPAPVASNGKGRDDFTGLDGDEGAEIGDGALQPG